MRPKVRAAPRADASHLLLCVSTAEDVAYVLVDAAGLVQTHSDGATALMGLPAGTQVGPSWADTVRSWAPDLADLPVLRDAGEAGMLVDVRDQGGHARRLLATAHDLQPSTLIRLQRLPAVDLAAAISAFVATSDRDAIIYTDAAGIVQYWNDAATRIFGWSADERVGRPLVERFPPDVREMVGSLMASLHGGLEWDGEFEDWHKDGSRVWIDARVRSLTGADGGVVGVLGISRDITARKRAEGERDRLWNLSPDPMCVAGMDGYFRQVNPAWSERLGWSDEELLRQPWLSLVHPDDVEATVAADASLAQGERVSGFENRYRAKDGRWHWFSWNSVPMPEQQSMLGFVRDVTENKQLAEQLQQSQKIEAIGRLAGGIAHDFNNLLTVINGFAALLLGANDLRSDQREALEAIRDAGVRAAGLTSQLLTFSRKAVVEPKVLDVNDVTESATRMLHRLIGEHITVETRLAPGLPRVRIDPGQLEQVLINLAVNARDAMPTGGTLRIVTRLVVVPAGAGQDGRTGLGRHVELVVSDTGVGMNDETKAHIFEPFFTTKAVGKGTGLGLATVHGIVQQAGGSIAADSAPGRGSQFTVRLPAVDTGTDHRAEASAAPPAPVSAGCVLLVEDEDAVRGLTRLALEMHGYTVLAASSPQQALAMSRSHDGPIDLLLTDVVMPGSGGRQLADELRQSRPAMRVLYMSGYTDDAIVLHGVEYAEHAFLPKPFTPTTLIQKVRDVLHG